MKISFDDFQRRIGAIMVPYGFCRGNKNSLICVKDEILQTVVLARNRHSCTILFSVLPLCLGISEFYDTGYDISVLRLDQKGWWDFESDHNSLEEMEDILLHKVVPLLVKCNDCKSAYQELVQYEKAVYTDIPGGVIMHNFAFVAMCIRAGDYQTAQKHMEAICTINERNVSINAERLRKRGDISGAEAYYNAKQPKLHEERDFLSKITSADVDFLEKFIIDNESVSHMFIKQLHRKLK